MPTKNLSLDEFLTFTVHSITFAVTLKDKIGPLRSKILLVKMEEKRIIL